MQRPDQERDPLNEIDPVGNRGGMHEKIGVLQIHLLEVEHR